MTLKHFILVIWAMQLSILGWAQESIPQIGTMVLLEHEGETIPVRLTNVQGEGSETTLMFRQERYLSSYNFSPRLLRRSLREAQYQTEVPSIQHQMHNENRTLRVGQIVLGRNNKTYIIRGVFPDGRMAVHPVVSNQNGGDRLGISRLFSVRNGTNMEVISRDDIVAQEVQSFRGYSYARGPEGVISEIEGIPLCDQDRIQEYNFPAHLRREDFPVSGCRHGRVQMGAIFSNGTFHFGTNWQGESRLINPFPTTIHQYQGSDPNSIR